MDVLRVVQAAGETGPVCDACVGRLVADRSFGLTNAERGRSLRITAALAEDEPYQPFGETDAECWVCEGESDRYDTWADRAVTAVRGYDFDTYQIGTSVSPLLEENDDLLREDVGLESEAGETLKSQLNREVGKRFGKQTGTEVDFGRPDVLVVLDLAADEVSVQVNSAFIYGRYRKLERNIPQTEWPCRECNETGRKQGAECPGCDGTGYRYDRSVEELTAPVVQEAMEGEDAVFHGAGREDVDARMLGDGRPFVIEVQEPRIRAVDTATLEAAINDFAGGAVEVTGIVPATHGMVERVKELEASKTYRMDVRFDGAVEESDFVAALDAMAGATIEQDTPQRVDHRRASKTRIREVYDVDGSLGADGTTAAVTVHGAGGLYVKELLSGDDGRTEPSIAGELGVDATVTALDVLDVTGEDEPFEDPDYFRPGGKDITPAAREGE